MREILILQEDFEVLTSRSNSLQHENRYFHQQIDDLEEQIEGRKEREKLEEV